MRVRVSCCLLLTLLTTSTVGQTRRGLTSAQIRALDAIATQDVPAGAPGVGVGVVRNGVVVYEKYAGYANLADSTRLSRQSRFNVASNGKQFTALAVLDLADKKKLRLDDDIRQYFPQLYPAVPDKIRVKDLLTHSSGIRDVYDLWALQGITWWKKTLTNQDALALLSAQQELNFKPGTRFLYSNSNYILLAELVSKVTGRSFKDYTDELFRKLDMPNTSFEPDYTRIRGPVANPYFNFATWVGYNWISNVYGDGSIFSTLPDQLRWEKVVQTGKGGGLARRVIEQSQQLPPPPAHQQYGYGLEFGTYKNRPYRFHEGSTGAWKATTIRFRAPDLAIVTLTNSGKVVPATQTRQMADVLLGGGERAATYATQPPAEGAYLAVEEVLGAYQTAADFTFQFEKRDTSLFLLRSGRNDTRLIRESANVFHQWNDPAFKQEFRKDSAGHLLVTAYYTTHAPYTLRRVEADWTDVSLPSWEGTFRNTETNAECTIKYQANRTYTVSMGKQKQKSSLITPTKLLADKYTLEAGPHSPGGIGEVFLSADRIQKVRFIRVPPPVD